MYTLKDVQNTTVKIINLLIHILFWGAIILIILKWNVIPEELPKHFDSNGQIDSYGSKGEIIVLFVTNAMMYATNALCMYVVPRLARAEKLYGKKAAKYASEEDIKQGILIALKLIVWMDLISIFFIDVVVFRMAANNPLPEYCLILYLVVLTLEIVWYMYRFLKKRKKITAGHIDNRAD